MSQSLTTVRYEWKAIPWRKLEVKVFKLQKRIYQASLREDVRLVHKLQRLLVKSWAAKCLAVRRVTQDNQGKKTAGVDGVKALKPWQRLKMVLALKVGASKLPTRRVYIPKPHSDEQRPLGIPVMQDRASQALLKLALEPEWEAKFEPNSYGFRPGRSVHDAIQAIHKAIRQKPKFVLDADIAKCFDRINHEALLEKISTFPSFARVIKAWLRTGVLDQGNLFPTEEGTPQGGVISPLLANIALHGLETAIVSAYPAHKKVDGQEQKWKPQLIRYADDFVILHPNRQVIEECKTIASVWLKGLGLELKPSKTRVTHTLQAIEECDSPGFDFLGFNIRTYLVGKNRSGKDAYGRHLGYRTFIKPSKENIKTHYRKLTEHIDRMRGATQEALIDSLTPMIVGWCNYYSSAVSSEIFSKLNYDLTGKLMQWGKRRHANKSTHWIVNKYWLLKDGLGWTFGVSPQNTLIKHTDIKIKRHIKVKGIATPYDGDWVYWSQRTGKVPGTPIRVSSALKRQQGKCVKCELCLKLEDLIEMHHLDGNHGNNRKDNLAAVHKHCHDQIHSKNGNLSTQLSIYVKDQLGEEPDEEKFSSPVLKSSRKGDLPA